jgi:putative nucleotidyltransferase with HDIG domain
MDGGRGGARDLRFRAPVQMPRPLTAFVAAIVLAGCAVILHSAAAVRHVPLNGYVALLAVLTIASGRFAIKVPGRPATVSVSEVFVFATVLLFGPAAATLIVALDGACMSATQQDRRLHRTLFNVAEPALSIWTAGHVFLALAPSPVAAAAAVPDQIVATIAMAATFFVMNSSLTAIALALESGAPMFAIWRRHSWYLAVNYYAAASLALLGVDNGAGLNLAVAGLVAPLLVVSYVAYREASTRLQEKDSHIRQVEHLYGAAVEMLAIAVDTKDQVTHGHIRRVQRHTVAVAKALGVHDSDHLQAIEAGSLLHDIGKLAVPDYILNKPGGLSRSEYETMKRHTTMGARILTAVEFPYPIVPIVRHHHEQWDGRGYPDGLAGSEIPLGARILAVVDCFDALTSDRPYRPRLTDEKARDILLARRGTFYDPVVVDKFIELIPALRDEDRALGEGPDERGLVVAGLARAPMEPVQTPDGDTVPEEPAFAGLAGALIDEQVGGVVTAECCLFAITRGGDRLVVAHATPGIRDGSQGGSRQTGAQSGSPTRRSTSERSRGSSGSGRARARPSSRRASFSE